MKAGYHAPLPPAPTGVAAYAAALLDALRPHAEVVPGASQADVHLYQLGNNSLHRAIHDRACREPGVVLLHDATLHHFYLGTLSRDAYIEAFSKQYGDWSRGLAETLWRERAGSAADPRYFDYPMLGNVVGSARAVLVHNAAAAARVHAEGATCPVIEIPHLLLSAPAPDAAELEALRTRLGIPASVCCFGLFGHLRPSKRAATVLAAFSALRRTHPAVRLVVAGEPVSEPYARAMAPLLDAPGVVHTGYLPERVFPRWLALADVCLNLRYPSAAETSGILIRMMDAGKVVVATAGAEMAAFPPASYVPVSSGVSEQAELEQWMRELAARPDWVRHIGQRARQHVRQHHAAARVAARVAEVLRAAC